MKMTCPRGIARHQVVRIQSGIQAVPAQVSIAAVAVAVAVAVVVAVAVEEATLVTATTAGKSSWLGRPRNTATTTAADAAHTLATAESVEVPTVRPQGHGTVF